MKNKPKEVSFFQLRDDVNPSAKEEFTKVLSENEEEIAGHIYDSSMAVKRAGFFHNASVLSMAAAIGVFVFQESVSVTPVVLGLLSLAARSESMHNIRRSIQCNRDVNSFFEHINPFE